MNAHLVDSIEDAYRTKYEYENETFSKFCVRGVRSKDFGKAELYCKKGNSCIMWFDSVPYIYVNQVIFDCKYGPDRHTLFKAKVYQKNEHRIATKSKKSVECTRKLGCPAKISLKEVFIFPDFKISSNNSYNKKKASKELRALLQEKSAKGIKKFILTLPVDKSEHKMHPVEKKPSLAFSSKTDDDCDKEAAILTSRTTTHGEKNSNVVTEEPVKQTRPLIAKRVEVRKMLAEIRTLSYKITDLSEMESLKDMLEPVLNYVSTKTVHQNGFTYI